jgi:preprotein translocase subunit SecG
MQFFIELLVWHLIIAAFLVGALMLSRQARQQNGTMTFADDTRNR